MNRCKRCGGTYIKAGEYRGRAFGSCVNCGHNPNAVRRRPEQQRPATHNRATLTRYDERAIAALTEGAK